MTTIVIPLYNEEDNVKDLIHEIARMSKTIKWVLVENGCTDNTHQCILKAINTLEIKNISLVELKDNRGYGHGLKAGLKEALGMENELVGWTHGDGQTELSDIQRAVDKFKVSDSLSIIKGSRVSRGDGRIAYYFTRLQDIVLKLFSAGFAIEPNAQPTLAKATLVKDVYSRCEDDGMFDLSFLFYAYRYNIKSGRIPVVFRKRHHGTGSNESVLSKIAFSVRNLRYIIKIASRGV